MLIYPPVSILQTVKHIMYIIIKIMAPVSFQDSISLLFPGGHRSCICVHFSSTKLQNLMNQWTSEQLIYHHHEFTSRQDINVPAHGTLSLCLQGCQHGNHWIVAWGGPDVGAELIAVHPDDRLLVAPVHQLLHLVSKDILKQGGTLVDPGLDCNVIYMDATVTTKCFSNVQRHWVLHTCKVYRTTKICTGPYVSVRN